MEARIETSASSTDAPATTTAVPRRLRVLRPPHVDAAVPLLPHAPAASLGDGLDKSIAVSTSRLHTVSRPPKNELSAPLSSSLEDAPGLNLFPQPNRRVVHLRTTTSGAPVISNTPMRGSPPSLSGQGDATCLAEKISNCFRQPAEGLDVPRPLEHSSVPTGASSSTQPNPWARFHVAQQQTEQEDVRRRTRRKVEGSFGNSNGQEDDEREDGPATTPPSKVPRVSNSNADGGACGDHNGYGFPSAPLAADNALAAAERSSQPSTVTNSIAGVSEATLSTIGADGTITGGSARPSSATPYSVSPLPSTGPPSSFLRRHQKIDISLPPPGAVQVRFLPFPTETVSTKYLVFSKIGQGTYGEVYKGRSKSDGKSLVALKKFKTIKGLDGFPLTSVREVIALFHIRDQLTNAETNYFVLLRDVLLDDDRLSIYFAFDYVPHSLAGLVMRGMVKDEKRIAFLFLRILRGLEILHRHQVLHRDIKMDNVLIDDDANVRLCDFGLSVPMGGKRDRLTPSLINLSYRPPEMLLGIASYSYGVDVWSAGCMLAQLFTGKPPFHIKDQLRAGELAQLEMITSTLGPLDFLEGPAAASALKKYPEFQLRSLQEPHENFPREGRRFSQWLRLQAKRDRLISQECGDVLDAMLQLNPAKRPSVSYLLGMPFFVRAAELESRSVTDFRRELRSLPESHHMMVQQEMHRHQQLQQQSHSLGKGGSKLSH